MPFWIALRANTPGRITTSSCPCISAPSAACAHADAEVFVFEQSVFLSVIERPVFAFELPGEAHVDLILRGGRNGRTEAKRGDKSSGQNRAREAETDHKRLHCRCHILSPSISIA